MQGHTEMLHHSLNTLLHTVALSGQHLLACSDQARWREL